MSSGPSLGLTSPLGTFGPILAHIPEWLAVCANPPLSPLPSNRGVRSSRDVRISGWAMTTADPPSSPPPGSPEVVSPSPPPPEVSSFSPFSPRPPAPLPIRNEVESLTTQLSATELIDNPKHYLPSDLIATDEDEFSARFFGPLPSPSPERVESPHLDAPPRVIHHFEFPKDWLDRAAQELLRYPTHLLRACVDKVNQGGGILYDIKRISPAPDPLTSIRALVTIRCIRLTDNPRDAEPLDMFMSKFEGQGVLFVQPEPDLRSPDQSLPHRQSTLSHGAACWTTWHSFRAIKGGAYGLIVDGAIKDTKWYLANRHNMWAAATSDTAQLYEYASWEHGIMYTYHHDGYEHKWRLRSGDWLLADNDGCLIVPRQALFPILELARASSTAWEEGIRDLPAKTAGLRR